jgi:hypothetical protein
MTARGRVHEEMGGWCRVPCAACHLLNCIKSWVKHTGRHEPMSSRERGMGERNPAREEGEGMKEKCSW